MGYPPRAPRRYSRDRSPPHRYSRDRSPPRRRYSRSPERSPAPRRHYSRERRSPTPVRRFNREPVPSCKVIGVFGLSLRTTERDLEEVFNQFGNIEQITLVHDKDRRSRGFGFINYSTISEAEEAVKKASGTLMDGREIRVDFSATKKPHTPTPGEYRGSVSYRDRSPPRRRRYSRSPPRRYNDRRRDDDRENNGRRSPRRYSRSPLIGSSEFSEYRKKNAIFVDKTHFIEEFIESFAKIELILRPRRFSKSTNLSMLKSFFTIGTDKSMFKGLKIYENYELMDTHCGSYPVVFLDLKNVIGGTWELTLSRLWKQMRLCAAMHKDAYRKMGRDPFVICEKYLERNVSCPDLHILGSSLFDITYDLYQYYGKEVIVLIDEYDTPLNNAHREGFYDKAAKFFASFYSQGLKGNNAVEKACIMGIAELRCEGLPVGLNNLSVNSFSTESYSSCFGFTIDEIKENFEVTDNDIERLKEWYIGYYFGGDQVINPWSIVNWWDNEKSFNSYWIQTCQTAELGKFLGGNELKMLYPLFYLLYEGDSYEIELSNTAVNYNNEWKLENIMTFLVLTGYLTYNENKVKIPNKEVKDYWKVDLLPQFNKAVKNKYGRRIQDLFMQDNLDVKVLTDIMTDTLMHTSAYDLVAEASYHCFFVGVFMACLNSEYEDITISSNKEAGREMYGINIKLFKPKKVCIFGFKHVHSERDLNPQVALQQIKEKQNYHMYQGLGYSIHLVGVSCYQKTLALAIDEL